MIQIETNQTRNKMAIKHMNQSPQNHLVNLSGWIS